MRETSRACSAGRVSKPTPDKPLSKKRECRTGAGQWEKVVEAAWPRLVRALIFVMDRGIVVIGQSDGQLTAWFAEAVFR
jgi:hypothetical protein